MTQTHHAGKTTLLEIDWQSWIDALVHDPAAAGRARGVRSIARSRGWPVVCSRYLSPDPDERTRSNPNSPEASFLAGLGPRPGDPVVTKYDRDLFDVPEATAVLAGLMVTAPTTTTHGRRMALLTGHRQQILAHRAQLNNDLQAIEAKIDHYADLIAQGRDCDAVELTDPALRAAQRSPQ